MNDSLCLCRFNVKWTWEICIHLTKEKFCTTMTRPYEMTLAIKADGRPHQPNKIVSDTMTGTFTDFIGRNYHDFVAELWKHASALSPNNTIPDIVSSKKERSVGESWAIFTPNFDRWNENMLAIKNYDYNNNLPHSQLAQKTKQDKATKG